MAEIQIYTTIFILCIVTMPLCTLTVVLRFFATRRSGRKISYEDWFALGSLTIHLVYAAMSFVSKLFPNGFLPSYIESHY